MCQAVWAHKHFICNFTFHLHDNPKVSVFITPNFMDKDTQAWKFSVAQGYTTRKRPNRGSNLGAPDFQDCVLNGAFCKVKDWVSWF